ncbi:hypothetical protein [Dictyobacter aurantiacus]|uniref:Uncharacterized protein n=1 Tax=Dictyobacter aurantiacus TaxID=1936993 RepID=A0A401ZRL5_9CHLR|nr:hypothetical protein [Dictyobacter aurantiacus]GCE09493.1 hypothetical protein KDAU_68220 [Dictyobacter aurantiacus]
MGSSMCVFIAQEDVTPEEVRAFVLGMGGYGDENPNVSNLMSSAHGYIMIFPEAEFIPALREDYPEDFQDVCTALSSKPQSVITIDISGHGDSYLLAFSFAYACMEKWRSSVLYFNESDPAVLTQQMISDIIRNKGAYKHQPFSFE